MAKKLVKTTWAQNLRVGKTFVTPEGVELDDSSEEYAAVKEFAKRRNVTLSEKTVDSGEKAPEGGDAGSEMTSDSASSAGSAPETNETPANAGRTRK